MIKMDCTVDAKLPLLSLRWRNEIMITLQTLRVSVLGFEFNSSCRNKPRRAGKGKWFICNNSLFEQKD